MSDTGVDTRLLMDFLGVLLSRADDKDNFGCQEGMPGPYLCTMLVHGSARDDVQALLIRLLQYADARMFPNSVVDWLMGFMRNWEHLTPWVIARAMHVLANVVRSGWFMAAEGLTPLEAAEREELFEELICCLVPRFSSGGRDGGALLPFGVVDKALDELRSAIAEAQKREWVFEIACDGLGC